MIFDRKRTRGRGSCDASPPSWISATQDIFIVSDIVIEIK